ncbi:NAD(P)-binding domain-containing protein [Acidobacterium sp. S8]|uniref:NAD(P)-binding domain-containing protein n=1 Tax=Acidobacterium sp. S8 TaxID=1641854 RepID=UPI00131C0ED0|nr:NAD(P)-binding domain-containing protein [Acidobacterium sp. S8]
MSKSSVVIIGAGPYGLSLAAHLKAVGIEHRVFGRPMHTWMTQMPQGMCLKSEGFASSLYEPRGQFTLAQYCRERKIPYADSGLPVRIETFVEYGLEFQRRFVPGLEDRMVMSVDQADNGFSILLDNGEEVIADKVVVAAGISHFAHVPPVLAGLPEEALTHSSSHADLSKFRGKEVAIIGAGASALDLAALLHQAGASVQVIARKSAIRFHNPPSKKPRTLFERASSPATGIGAGWKLFFCVNTPWAFRWLPENTRLKAVKNILGPAPGWFIKEQVVGKMPLHLGMSLKSAYVDKSRVQIDLIDSDGKPTHLAVDHVIAATGYKVDLQRLQFLSPEIQGSIQSVEKTPVLSSNFMSSVPGLYFVGTSAANTFGPLMRFAFGAGFAAQRVCAHLATAASQETTREESPTLETMENEKVAIR